MTTTEVAVKPLAEITVEDYRAAMVFLESVVKDIKPLQELKVQERRCA